MDTRNRAGNFQKNITVFSNDPRKNRERLVLKGSVKPLIILAPSSSITLTGKAGETKSMDLNVTAGLDKPLKLEPGKFNMEGKVSYVLETIEEGKKYRINFRNHPDVSGNFNGFLRIGTNYKEKPSLVIRINSRFK